MACKPTSLSLTLDLREAGRGPGSAPMISCAYWKSPGRSRPAEGLHRHFRTPRTSRGRTVRLGSADRAAANRVVRDGSCDMKAQADRLPHRGEFSYTVSRSEDIDLK